MRHPGGYLGHTHQRDGSVDVRQRYSGIVGGRATGSWTEAARTKTGGNLTNKKDGLRRNWLEDCK